MKKILFIFLMAISLSSCVTINYINYDDDTEQEQITDIKSDTVQVQHNFVKNFVNGKIVYGVKVNNETYYYDEAGRLLYKTSQPN